MKRYLKYDVMRTLCEKTDILQVNQQAAPNRGCLLFCWYVFPTNTTLRFPIQRTLQIPIYWVKPFGRFIQAG